MIKSLLLVAFLSGLDETFIRGDCNADGAFDNQDALMLLEHIFNGGPITCKDAADFTNDGSLWTPDAVALLMFAYQGGPPPAEPWPECGPDTEYFYGCEFHPCQL